MRSIDEILEGRSYGTTMYNGTEYILLRDAFLDNGPHGQIVFRSYAVKAGEEADEDGLIPCYEVVWWPLDEWLEQEDCEDEGDACNWDEADEVRSCGAVDPDDGRII